MVASIETTLYEFHTGPVIPGSTVTGASRDDLRRPYEVYCHSVNVATTYTWALTFTPSSPGSVGAGTPNEGTPSSATLTSLVARNTTFVVDFEGSYLLNLVVDAGLPTESTQSVRLRRLTSFAKMKLVASGERRDSTGIIPVDVSVDGWTLDQNQNLQRLMLMTRRGMTSGRVLYVDANRGRNNTNAQNDPTNLVYLPGTDGVAEEATGTKLSAEGFADFDSINDAIFYATTAATRGEAAPALDQPYFVVIQPGVYKEALFLYPHIHLVGNCPPPDLYYNPVAAAYQLSASVLIDSTGIASHTFPTVTGFSEVCSLQNLAFTNSTNRTDPLWDLTGGKVLFKECAFLDQGMDANQGDTIKSFSATNYIWVTLSDCKLHKMGFGETVIRHNCIFGKLEILSSSITQSGNSDGIWFNEGMKADTTLTIKDSEIYGNLLGVGFCGSTLNVSGSVLSGSTGSISIAALVTPGPKAGSILMNLRDLDLTGDILFDSGVCNTTSLLYRNVTSSTSTGLPLTLVGGGNLPTVFRPFGSFPVTYKQVNVGNSPYQMVRSDLVVGFLSNTGVTSVTLPSSPEPGKMYSLKDEGGNASVNNITVSPYSGLIEGAGSLVMNINYEAVGLYSNGTNWFVC